MPSQPGADCCQQNLKNKIVRLLCRLHRYGYTPTLLHIEQTLQNQMLRDADEVLFHKVLKTAHCLNNLLSQQKCLPMELRPAGHNVNYQFVTITYTKTPLLFVVFFSYCNAWLQLR